MEETVTDMRNSRPCYQDCWHADL